MKCPYIIIPSCIRQQYVRVFPLSLSLCLLTWTFLVCFTHSAFRCSLPSFFFLFLLRLVWAQIVVLVELESNRKSENSSERSEANSYCVEITQPSFDNLRISSVITIISLKNESYALVPKFEVTRDLLYRFNKTRRKQHKRKTERILNC